MPSHPDPSNKQGSTRREASDLLNDYQILSREYDQILRISQEILNELSGDRDETRLSGLLNQKLKIGKNIELLSQRIAGRNIEPSSSRKSILDQARKEIENISSKAGELLYLERRIRKLIENS
jgi:hypothetical protein